MNLVTGAAVKAAVQTAAVKQVAASGLAVSNASVTWQGETAFVVCNRNKRSVAFNINYPMMSDGALLTRAEANIVTAITLHETGHVLFTDMDAAQVAKGYSAVAKQNPELWQAIWNGLEDPRMEASVIRLSPAANASQLFRLLLARLTSKLNGDWNPCLTQHAPVTLAVLGRQAFGYGNEFTARLLKRIPEPKRGVYLKALRALREARLGYDGTSDVFPIVDAFIAEWLALDQTKVTKVPVPDMPQPSSEDASIWEEGEEDESDEEFDDPDEIFQPEVQASPDASPAPAIDEADEAEDGDEQGDGESDEGSGSDADAEEAGDWDNEPGEPGGEADEDDLKGDSDDLGDEGDDYGPDEEEYDGEPDEGAAKDGPGSGASDGQYEDEGDDVNAKPKSPEPDLSDIVSSANKRDRSRNSNSALWQAPVAKRAAVTNTDKSTRRYAAYYPAQQRPLSSGLKAQIVRLLHSVDRVGWKRGASFGRFDPRRAARMAAGSESVFQKRWERGAINSRVSIVIDMSSSMLGPSIAMAAETALNLSEACERAGAKVEVLGFVDNDSAARRVDKAYGHDMSGKYRYGVGAYVSCFLYPFKKFEQKTRDRVESILKAPERCGGGTPDWPAVATVVKDMIPAPEQRKIVFVLTDGIGYQGEMLASCHEAEEHGVVVIGLGIQTIPEMMANTYKRWIRINDISDMASAAMSALIRELKREMPAGDVA